MAISFREECRYQVYYPLDNFPNIDFDIGVKTFELKCEYTFEIDKDILYAISSEGH